MLLAVIQRLSQRVIHPVTVRVQLHFNLKTKCKTKRQEISSRDQKVYFEQLSLFLQFLKLRLRASSSTGNISAQFLAEVVSNAHQQFSTFTVQEKTSQPNAPTLMRFGLQFFFFSAKRLSVHSTNNQKVLPFSGDFEQWTPSFPCVLFFFSSFPQHPLLIEPFISYSLPHCF